MNDQIMNYPTANIDFSAAWSQAAGESTALRSVVVYLEDLAGRAYISGHDAVALALRDAAKEVSNRAKTASNVLDGFIKEQGRREHEKTRLFKK